MKLDAKEKAYRHELKRRYKYTPYRYKGEDLKRYAVIAIFNLETLRRLYLTRRFYLANIQAIRNYNFYRNGK